MTGKLRNEVINLSKENKQLNETVLDLQMCSMQDNWIFQGLQEVENEDAEETLKLLFRKELDISEQ